ncbi:MAG: RagB/SusD family nutrient uptake outer membrane protein [Gemmatimonadota bacterium]|nr:RagB/SusD family nutrient uptake outer membrane protein [Gemmatimonadota bacterium]
MTASLMLAMGVSALGGCDLDVTNPGPVTDEFLNDPLAQPALVNTIGLAYVAAFNRVAYQQTVVTRELHFAGQTGFAGFSFDAHLGRLDSDNVDVQWNNTQRARWVADDAVRRLREGLGDSFSSNANAARALLWQGYAYRLMGENWCHGVIDGGEPEPSAVFFERAEEAFSEAIDVGSGAGLDDVVTAARAGRASVRIWLDDWSGAVADADEVPTSFVHQLETSTLEEDQYNRVFFGSSNTPWRAHSTWNTFYEDYYLETGDPRTSWDEDPDFPFGNAEVTGIGQVPWFFQTKYPTLDAPYPLSKGTEMRLIEAEARLRENDREGAMELINEVRTGLSSDHDDSPLPEWEADTLEEAWTHLKRERGIELWLEGRRLGDLRRWIQEGTPGTTDDMTDRSLCYPIPRGERQQNPNVPLDFQEAPTG